MEQAESTTVDGSLSAQAVPRLVWNLKVRYTMIPSQVPNPEPAESSLHRPTPRSFNPLKPELNPICYLLALLGAHHFLHVSRIRVKLLTLR